MDNSMRDLIIIGIGGCGREAAWIAEKINKNSPTWNVLGFVDDDPAAQNMVINGYPVLGTLESITSYPDAWYICAIGASRTKEKVVRRMKTLLPGVHFATIIDPSVEISEYVSIGEGTIVSAHAVITVNITIGSHVLVEPDCTIGHDAVIHDFVTLYPSVNVSGSTEIGYCTELGVGMQIIQGKRIGDYCIIGAGAVVIRDIPSKCTAVGSPAKPIKFFD